MTYQVFGTGFLALSFQIFLFMNRLNFEDFRVIYTAEYIFLLNSRVWRAFKIIMMDLKTGPKKSVELMLKHPAGFMLLKACACHKRQR